ncbi:hypothetical protein B5M09_001870 [Aphanomyces astaci]|uniref:DNA ligase n=1 Tax=Aphanomyces astaci TaxID=112090 RepID=A0A3R7W8R5_APHAT|nr:hypothetical protein B5M09_001870 [Aphanomyces astaci]
MWILTYRPHDDDHGLLLLYNPKEKNPMKRGGWTAGDPVPYAALSKVFAVIEDESSRLIIQDTLADFFRSVIELTPSDLVSCIYLCVCTELAPAYDNVQIGIGDAILIKSIGEATGTTPKFVKDLYQKQGDLGKVAQASRSKQSTLMTFQTKPKPLAVAHVYNDMVKIAKMSGNNSQASKCSIIKSLLVRCDKLSDEAKYVIRGLQGKLRIGLAGQSILMSLTQAFMHPKEQGDKALQAEALKHVKRAFSEFPNYEVLASSLLTVFTRENDQKGVFASQFVELAEFCHLTAGTPVSPMLARPTKSYAMVLDRFQAMPFTCEYKYDGERAQIHILPNGDIRIFSRNFENSTERFPDVKLSIANAAAKANVTSCIVDAEVVAVDKTTNQRLPFQVLSTRPRKVQTTVSVEFTFEIKVAVCIYAFDLLFLNGKPLQARREALKGMFQVTPGSFEFATSLDVANTKDDDMESTVEIVRNFLEEAVAGNCEGLMVKTLSTEATYEPANRSHKWLKVAPGKMHYIVDGPNVAYLNQNFEGGAFRFDYVDKVITELEAQGHVVSVTMPSIYFNEKSLLSVKASTANRRQRKEGKVFHRTRTNADKAFLDKWEATDVAFKCRREVHVAPDDLFWLYASLFLACPPQQHNVRVVTNDIMRDHIVVLTDRYHISRDLIDRWRDNTLVGVRILDRNLKPDGVVARSSSYQSSAASSTSSPLQMEILDTLPYSLVVQGKGTPSYHVPVVSTSSAVEWLCLTRAAKHHGT